MVERVALIFWLIQAIWNIYACILNESYLLLTHFLTNTGDLMKFLRMQSYLLKIFEQAYLTIFYKCRRICKNHSQHRVRFILLDSAFGYYVTKLGFVWPRGFFDFLITHTPVWTSGFVPKSVVLTILHIYIHIW